MNTTKFKVGVFQAFHHRSGHGYSKSIVDGSLPKKSACFESCSPVCVLATNHKSLINLEGHQRMHCLLNIRS